MHACRDMARAGAHLLLALPLQELPLQTTLLGLLHHCSDGFELLLVQQLALMLPLQELLPEQMDWLGLLLHSCECFEFLLVRQLD